MNYTTAALFTAGIACGLSAQTREHAEPSMVLRLPAPPALAFPLFGPVRETEWAPEWSPTILYPPDRSQKAGAVFTTTNRHQDRIWVLSTYDEAALKISYVIVRPRISAGQLDIALRAVGQSESEVTVTHRVTSLSEEGDAHVKTMATHFPLEREEWEQAISARLRELMGR